MSINIRLRIGYISVIVVVAGEVVDVALGGGHVGTYADAAVRALGDAERDVPDKILYFGCGIALRQDYLLGVVGDMSNLKVVICCHIAWQIQAASSRRDIAEGDCHMGGIALERGVREGVTVAIRCRTGRCGACPLP